MVRTVCVVISAAQNVFLSKVPNSLWLAKRRGLCAHWSSSYERQKVSRFIVGCLSTVHPRHAQRFPNLPNQAPVLTLKNRRRIRLTLRQCWPLSDSKMCSSLTVELVADGHLSVEVIRSAFQEGVKLRRARQILDHAPQKHARHQSLCVVKLGDFV